MPEAVDVTEHGDSEPVIWEVGPEAAGRYFDGGAYRDTDAGKLDFEGFLNPLVLQAFGEYMDAHRKQSDGRLRDSDNWQAGIPRAEYLKSLLRHVHDLWMEHRGYESRDGIDEALGGIVFNVMGFWLETLKDRDDAQHAADSIIVKLTADSSAFSDALDGLWHPPE